MGGERSSRTLGPSGPWSPEPIVVITDWFDPANKQTNTDTQKNRHTDTETHRHTDTQTHRHTDTQKPSLGHHIRDRSSCVDLIQSKLY